MLDKKTYEKIYRILESTTPLKTDCGTLCNKICCTNWTNEVGMYLLPGEEQMFTFQEDWLTYELHSAEEYEFCPEWTGSYYFLKCTRPCPREKRPFQCRVFPLKAHITRKGRVDIVMDTEYEKLCPLIAKGIPDLEPDFVESVRQAYNILLNDPLIYADILWESEKIKIK